jgi:hypothetical protein
MRKHGLEASLPFMNIIQACKIEKWWRFPNANELRWQVYTSLAYGARGICYFLYWGPEKFNGLYRDGKPTNLLGAVSQLNAEIAALSPELIKRKSLSVYHVPSILLPDCTHGAPATAPVTVAPLGQYVVGIFGSGDKPDKPDSFMIVNRDYRFGATAHISLQKHVRLVAEFDREKHCWKAPPGKDWFGTYPIDLKAGDGKLFLIGETAQ